jgi:4-hydroxy-3-methylbut-2-enyl diphosphate reductase
MEILTASFGFCIGINRAYRGMNERALAEAPFTVAHQNSKSEFDTLRRIERRDPGLLERYPGLGRVSVAYDVAELDRGDRLVLGFHGLPSDDKEALAGRGVDLLDDLICPFIAKLDRVVERHAEQGFDIAIVGTRHNHHCVTASEIAARHGRRCFVIERVEDVEALPLGDSRPIALVGQVTGNTETFKAVIDRLQKFAVPVKIVKTMCSDSHARQKDASALAQEADLVILYDDGGDASQSVFQVCSRVNPRVYRIKSKDEIRAEWFDGANKAAIVGGIMVPEWSIQEVARHVRAICA